MGGILNEGVIPPKRECSSLLRLCFFTMKNMKGVKKKTDSGVFKGNAGRQGVFFRRPFNDKAKTYPLRCRGSRVKTQNPSPSRLKCFCS